MPWVPEEKPLHPSMHFLCRQPPHDIWNIGITFARDSCLQFLEFLNSKSPSFMAGILLYRKLKGYDLRRACISQFCTLTGRSPLFGTLCSYLSSGRIA